MAFFIIFVWGIVLTARRGPVIDHSDTDPDRQHKTNYVQDGVIDMVVGLVGLVMQVFRCNLHNY